jgi:hypothetical protein
MTHKTLIVPTSAESTAILENHRPPQFAIDAAIAVGWASPCAKSKRGVVLYNDEDTDRWAAGSAEVYDLNALIAGVGFNGPPPGFKCLGADKCGEDCARLCLHAEDRAIRTAGIADDVQDLVLVHVKVVDGELVPGKRPCCEACSKVIVEVGLKGVWLYEEVGAMAMGGGGVAPRSVAFGEWRFYDAVSFHLTTLDNLGLPYAYTKPRES